MFQRKKTVVENILFIDIKNRYTNSKLRIQVYQSKINYFSSKFSDYFTYSAKMKLRNARGDSMGDFVGRQQCFAVLQFYLILCNNKYSHETSPH